MKKASLLLVGLWFWASAAAQYSEWELSNYKRDSLTRMSVDLYVPPKNPADTLLRTPHRIDCDRRLMEVAGMQGGTTFHFDVQEYNMPSVMRGNYAFRILLTRPLGEGVYFEADWSYFSSRTPGFPYPYYDPQEVMQVCDTLITSIYPAEAGGVTPEGQVYRICGERVKRVATTTRAVFGFSLMVEQGRWCVSLGQIEIPCGDCSIDAFSYRLPILRKVEIKPQQFVQMRDKVVSKLREYLLEKRDSVIASGWYGDPKLRAEKLNEMQARLASDWASAQSVRLTDLSAAIGYRYFITDAVVEMKDGHTERFIHVATYETNIP